MKNKRVESSRQQTIAWGYYLMETFRMLHIPGNQVIKNCSIGRRTYYAMKVGKQINADAYVRLTVFALERIRERESGWHPPLITVEEWEKQFLRIITEGDSSISGHR